MKRLALVTAFAAAALLAGCGGGVQFEGQAFEALGLTGTTKSGEKKVPDRAPLLIPPDRARLPQPQLATASARPQEWPSDPDVIRRADASEGEKKRKEYEDKGDWSPNASIDEFEKLFDSSQRKRGIFSSMLKDEN